MGDAFYKFLPLAFGGFLGWLLLHPPAWLEALGPLSWLVNLVLVALLLLSIVPFLALANLPENLQMRPLPESDAPAELQRLRRQFHGLGFHDAGPPLRVEIRAPGNPLGLRPPDRGDLRHGVPDLHGPRPRSATTSSRFSTATVAA